MNRAAITSALARLAPPILLLPAALAAQSPVGTAPGGGGGGPESLRALPAVRAATAPSIDGRLDDEAWREAPAARDFVQRRPDAGRPASQRSEARVLLDDRALYVAMRLYDTAPDSVAGTLGRRDFMGFSDWAQVIVDSYHDRRTAFRFALNPAGVKADAFLSGDDEWSQDPGWDAVWEGAAARDSLGWTAEMRIPLSQLRFSAAADGERVWGIQFVRDIARRSERALWAPAAPEAGGFVSRFGELRGVSVSPARRLEVVPYALGRLTREPVAAADPFHRPNDWFGSLGADVRYGLTSDLTLTATLNPDFGQVEADPSEVNLSGSETFLSERRPFFVEGGDIFQVGMAEAPWIHGMEQLFYSRRIGRAPHGSAPDGALYADEPAATTLIGAAKLSGKTAGGWSVGVLEAVTAPERARFLGPDGASGSVPVEPLTSFTVARVIRDFDRGRGALGGVASLTRRSLSDGLRDLPESALVGGVDARRRFGGGAWEVNALLLGSRLDGDSSAIGRVARGPVHRMQRPDAGHLEYGPARESLSGYGATLRLQKVAGGSWRGGVAAHTLSPGFEANDLGYHTASDFLRGHAWVGYDRMRPGRWTRSWSAWLNSWSGWSYGGERIAGGAELFGSVTLPSLWSGWGSLRREPASLSPTALRGGPALRQPGRTSGHLSVETDGRRAVSLELSTGAAHTDEGGRFLRVSPEVEVRPSERMELSLSPALSWNRDPAQWVERVGERYLVGALEQATASLTTRLGYSFTPDLSLQLYAQPFLSGGRFTKLRQVRDPRSPDFAGRFLTYGADRLARGADGDYAVDADGDGAADFSLDDPDFGVRELSSNLVLRWEYRSGSTLFLVWGQSRAGEGGEGAFDLERDAERLMGLPASNVLLLKWSHWLGR